MIDAYRRTTDREGFVELLREPLPEWRGNVRGIAHLTRCLPFYASLYARSTYAHRVRSGRVYMYEDEPSHVSLAMWCGQNGSLTGRYARGELLPDPGKRHVCATCEGRALGAGMSSSVLVARRPRSLLTEEGGMNQIPYDSSRDTRVHIAKVQANLAKVCGQLGERAAIHDETKLVDPEKPVFDEIRPLLDTCEYGSDDYKALMVRLGAALEHHFEHNRHHPEFHDDGVNDRTLLDLIEMVCDWQAAAKPDGDVRKGLPYNFERYGIDPQLAGIIKATVEALWP